MPRSGFALEQGIHMSLHTWALFAVAYLVTTLSPGPNVLLVVRNSVRFGAQGTAATIAGNLCAQLIVVMLVALGVGAAIAAIPSFFFGMKVVGAMYLIYLGIKQLRNASSRSAITDTSVSAPVAEQKRIFREALLVSGSNPKTLIFLSAFMPQFISKEHSLALQFALMYLTIAAIVVVVHTVYSTSVQRISKGLGANRWILAAKRTSGVLFVVLGFRLLTARQA